MLVRSRPVTAAVETAATEEVEEAEESEEQN